MVTFCDGILPEMGRYPRIYWVFGMQGALTPRYAKPEARSRRAPKTARPANGVPPSRVLYERPSSPSAVEWEIPPVSAFAVRALTECTC